MTEKKRFVRLIFAVGLCAGLFSFSAHAELGMQGIVTEKGLPALGSAVKNAVDAAYQSTNNPVVLEAKLVALLNEAASTQNEDIIRYAITGVMLGGGSENLALSKSAIDNSDVFKNYPDLTAVVVATCEKLIPGFEQVDEEVDMAGDEPEAPEAPDADFGGDPVVDNPFDGADDADVEDGDVEATDT